MFEGCSDHLIWYSDKWGSLTHLQKAFDLQPSETRWLPTPKYQLCMSYPLLWSALEPYINSSLQTSKHVLPNSFSITPLVFEWGFIVLYNRDFKPLLFRSQKSWVSNHSLAIDWKVLNLSEQLLLNEDIQAHWLDSWGNIWRLLLTVFLNFRGSYFLNRCNLIKNLFHRVLIQSRANYLPKMTTTSLKHCDDPTSSERIIQWKPHAICPPKN